MCHEVFFRMYLPLALEVYNQSFIGSLSLMAVGKFKKHLLGLTKSNILTLALISALTLSGLGRMREAVSIFDFVRPYRCFLLYYSNN